MIRRIFVVLLGYFLVVGLPHSAYGDLSTVMAAKEQARASVEAAWIFGVAIAIAGVVIAAGLYFGLRGRQNSE